jgi:hypothetical protein
MFKPKAAERAEKATDTSGDDATGGPK